MGRVSDSDRPLSGRGSSRVTDLYLTDARHVDDAARLIATFGASAGLEAAIQAGHSASIGNHRDVCKWRQVERLIDVLSATAAVGTVH